MLKAHPAILRGLVEQYHSLQALHTEVSTPETSRRLEDVIYTLCVSTGTRVIEDALDVAERQLTEAMAGPADPPGATGDSVALIA